MSVITFLETENQFTDAYTYVERQTLKRISTFRIGGEADIVVYPKDVTALKKLLLFLVENSIRYKVAGKLSNLLFDDAGFRGVLILTDRIRSIDYKNRKILTDVGVSLTRLCDFALQNSVGGFEDLFGIPASVGGAIYMNAGAFDTSVSNLIESVTVFDPYCNQETVLTTEALNFGPRQSLLQSKPHLIALSAAWRANASLKEDVFAKMKARMEHRRKTQPLDFPSAGSVFRRPKGHFAGALIEGAGLKGCRVGDAMVSEKHAGFIVNCGNALAKDVLALIEKIQQEVERRSGVRLLPEIEYIPEA